MEPQINIAGSDDYFLKGVNFASNVGEESLSFTSNVDWSITIANTANGEKWCTVTPNSGKAGEHTVRIKVDENSGTDDRSVSLILRAGELTKTILVTQKQKNALTLTSDRFEVAKDGGTINVEVKANVNFEVIIPEIYKSWINQSTKTRGMSTHNLTFNIASSEEYDKREGEVIIQSGELSETVHIFQTGEGILLLTKNELSVSDKGEDIVVEVKSNFDFDVKMPNVDWLKKAAKTRGMSSHSLYYTIAKNENYDSREAEIIYYDKNSNVADTLKIVQVQKDAIVISKKEYSLNNREEYVEVEVASNIDFVVNTFNSDWIIQVQNSTTKGLVSHKLNFKIAANTTYDERIGKIAISDKGNNVTDTIVIKQHPSLYLALKQKEYVISDEGGQITVELSSNIEYEVKMPQMDWITAATTRNLSSHTLYYTILPNTTYDSRKAEIIYYNKNCNMADTLKIMQAQKAAIILSQKNMEVSAMGGIMEVMLNTNVDFEMQLPNVDWIKSVATTRGLVECRQNLKIAENNSVTRRIGQVVFKSKEGDIADTLTIIQSSTKVDVNIERAGSLSSLIDDGLKLKLKELSIKGDLNGTDILLIRKMASEAERLEVLNISEANIVSGGDIYYETDNVVCRTSDDIIGEHMFYNLPQLKSIILPNSARKIGDYAFMFTRGLVEITIPDNVSSIGYCAFDDCENMEKIRIPSSVTTVGNRAFYGCHNLKSIYIEDLESWCNIEFGGSYAVPFPFGSEFDLYINGKKTKDIIIPPTVTHVGDYAFFGCTALHSVVFSNNLISLGRDAFAGCRNLASITIPNSVIEIGKGAFSGCSYLASVFIGSGVETISGMAFYNCIRLENIYCYAVTPPSVKKGYIFNDIFYRVDKTRARLYVPKGAKDKYMSSDWGNVFNNIIELEK